MIRIPRLDEASADADTAELLGAVKKKTGCLPNLIATMANSPAVARAWIQSGSE